MSGEFSGSASTEPLAGFAQGASATIVVELHRTDALFGVLSVSDGTFSGASLQRVVALEHDRLGQAPLRPGALLSFIGVVKVSSGPFAGQHASFVVSYLSPDRIELRIVLGANQLFGLFHLKKK